MSEFIFFTIGTLIGGLIGITTMCLFQINNINRYYKIKEDENEKKYRETHFDE